MRSVYWLLQIFDYAFIVSCIMKFSSTTQKKTKHVNVLIKHATLI